MKECGALVILLAAIVITACSSQKSDLVKRPNDGQQPPKTQSQTSSLRQKAQSLLEKRQYRQALALTKGRYHDGLEKEHVQAINGLLEVGDDAFSAGDYAAAGHSYRAALSAYPVEPSIRTRISHDPKQLRSRQETCADHLMEQGIEEYRRGRLESAIRKWKELLAINPGHTEAKKSLDTATVQLHALQNIKGN